MAKLKGLKRVNRIINEFLQSEFGLSATIGPDFEYRRDNHLVQYTLLVTETSDDLFNEFCHNLRPDIHADIFLLSLLHEVGHHFTQYSFPEYHWDDTNDIKEEISLSLGLFPNKAADLHNEYFNLDVEKAATEWGLTYMDTHDAELADFWAELQPAIMRFYRKNGLI